MSSGRKIKVKIQGRGSQRRSPNHWNENSIAEHEKKDPAGIEIFPGKYEMDRLASGLMEEDDGEGEKVLISKPALDRLLHQYDDELTAQLDLLAEADEEQRRAIMCRRSGFYSFRDWLYKQSALVAASKGALTPKPSSK